MVLILILNLHQTFHMKILITGGSGLVGSALTKKLLDNKIEVVHLTRSKSSKFNIKNYEWDWRKGEIDTRCFNEVTHIVHLAGAGIADKPWTTKRKKTIIKSRVLTTRLLLESIKRNGINIESFISASGSGYYGAQSNEKIYSEEDTSHNDFLGNCCKQWENSVEEFRETCRVVKFRLGVILDKSHGALPKISGIIKKGLGSPLGTGKQYMPWIHIEDAVNLFYNAIFDDKINGTYNAAASEHINNSELTEKIAHVLNKKIRLPNVPSFVLKFLYGELSDTILKGVRISNKKIKQKGFNFKFDSLEEALNQIYS